MSHRLPAESVACAPYSITSHNLAPYPTTSHKIAPSHRLSRVRTAISLQKFETLLALTNAHSISHLLPLTRSYLSLIPPILTPFSHSNPILFPISSSPSLPFSHCPSPILPLYHSHCPLPSQSFTHQLSLMRNHRMKNYAY